MSETVTHYGVHWAPGKVAYLHQHRGGFNVIGSSARSPFVVQTCRKWTCNHIISLITLGPSRRHLFKLEELITRNSLVKFMLPLPKTDQGVGVFHTECFEDDLLSFALLCKLSSPIRLPIFHLGANKPHVLLSELEMTNVQPLVIASASVEHMSLIQTLITHARTAPRKLLILAAPDVPLPRVPVLDGNHFYNQDEVDMIALPWETLGALVLKAYMKGEWDNAWFTTEPTPANEPYRNTDQTHPS